MGFSHSRAQFRRESQVFASICSFEQHIFLCVCVCILATQDSILFLHQTHKHSHLPRNRLIKFYCNELFAFNMRWALLIHHLMAYTIDSRTLTQHTYFLRSLHIVYKSMSHSHIENKPQTHQHTQKWFSPFHLVFLLVASYLCALISFRFHKLFCTY